MDTGLIERTNLRPKIGNTTHTRLIKIPGNV